VGQFQEWSADFQIGAWFIFKGPRRFGNRRSTTRRSETGAPSKANGPTLEENAVRKTARSFARYWLEDCGRPPLEQKPLFAFTFVKFQDNSTR
jgi:hypothetical protein